MKILTIIIALFLFSSCSKNDDCIAIRYGEAFVAEINNTYCFEDGNELQIDSIINAFCPCAAVCIWEGQMEVDMTWTINGSSYNLKHNSAATILDSTQNLPIDITIESNNIVFEVECDQDNPSPDIVSTELVVSKF
jgi:hypothetical protein